MKKKCMLTLILSVAVMLLGGCGSMSAEDAKLYTQSILDASYKGEFKEYIEQTESTEEEAQKIYDASLDVIMAESGFEELGISDELEANYRQLFQDMLQSAKYEVGEAKKEEDDSYTLDVKVCAFTAFEGVTEETEAWLTEQYADATEVPTQEELNEQFLQKMYELMTARLADPSYGEEQMIAIHVKPDSEGVWYIPEEDLTAIDSALYPEDMF
ncbi:MAG: hypothetical protein ACI4V6_07260 [Dorea sp.]